MLGGLAIASFAVTVVGLWLLLGRFGRVALDRPNERSLHERPVPRTGGIALLAGALVSVAFGAGDLWLETSLALALAVLSFLDDLRTVPTLLRLTGHLVAAAVLVWYLLSPMHPVELVVIAVALAWMTNLYNFMDGSDGLAGGMSLIGFGTYGVAAGQSGHVPLLALTVGLAAASLGFLLFNFAPAKVFLGDVGSVPLGFLAGALGIHGWRDDLWPLWFPVLVFAPFIGDATLTLVRRALRGAKVWQAHREHYYQRLVRLGFGHRGTAYIGYALMLLCAALALYGRAQRPAVQWTMVAGGVVVLGVVAGWIELRWRRRA
jgi:UDP-N-acetylmuramyl pentapeptide phosphotransferase/UDP-N-acetylglucosamine-1-phosphate transferase